MYVPPNEIIMNEFLYQNGSFSGSSSSSEGLKFKHTIIDPNLRVVVESFANSEFGNFIEYRLVVLLKEGARQSWPVYKRYSDFVKLHESLLGVFRNQLLRQSCIQKSNMIVPILPQMIVGTKTGSSDCCLEERLKQL
jgi:hypothetical protein